MAWKIGDRYGCYEIVGGQDVYQKEYIQPKLERLKAINQKYIEGDSSLVNYHCPDEQEYNNKRGYKVQCKKCGKIYYFSESDFEEGSKFLSKKWRKCYDEDCGRPKPEYIKHESWDVDLVGTIHESLEVMECVDKRFEIESRPKSRKYPVRVTIYKKYKCRCYLCGWEGEFLSSDFDINLQYDGVRRRYDCKARCKQKSWDGGFVYDPGCHCYSSFQWRTVKILKEYNVPYLVEWGIEKYENCFDDKEYIRYFDFAIYDTHENKLPHEIEHVRYFIECQGEQHYRPVDDFGGEKGFQKCKLGDDEKREFAQRHKIPLIEIPYTCNTLEKEISFLQKKGII